MYYTLTNISVYINIMNKNTANLNTIEDQKVSGAMPGFTPNFYNPFETKHRRRTSRGQVKILEKAFHDNPKPNGRARERLAESLSMSPRGVQIWFQNRRAKAKNQQQQDPKQDYAEQSHDKNDDSEPHAKDNFQAVCSDENHLSTYLSTSMDYSHSQSSLSSYSESLDNFENSKLSNVHLLTQLKNHQQPSKHINNVHNPPLDQHWIDSTSVPAEEEINSEKVCLVPSVSTFDQFMPVDQEWWVNNPSLTDNQNTYDRIKCKDYSSIDPFDIFYFNPSLSTMSGCFDVEDNQILWDSARDHQRAYNPLFSYNDLGEPISEYRNYMSTNNVSEWIQTVSTYFTDKNDARKLSSMLRQGFNPPHENAQQVNTYFVSSSIKKYILIRLC